MTVVFEVALILALLILCAWLVELEEGDGEHSGNGNRSGKG